MAVLAISQTLTGSFANLGSAFNISAQTNVGVALDFTPNNSTDIELQLLIITSDSDTEFIINSEKIILDSDNNAWVFFNVPDNTKQGQLKIKAGTVGGTAGIVDNAFSVLSRKTIFPLPNFDKVDLNNSTVTPLGADAVFTGIGTDVSEYANITIQLFADQNSATDGMQFQFSTDNVNWDDSFDFTFTANQARRFQYPITAKYFRIVFTNGNIEQTELRIQTLLHRAGVLTTIHRISDSISADNSAQLIKAILSGQKPNGDFVNFSATAGGNFKMSLEELDDAVKGQQDQVDSLAITLAKDHYDEITRCISIISQEHHEIHEEDHYFYSDCITLGNGATQDYMLTVPDDAVRKHFTFNIKGSLKITVAIFEGGDRTGTTPQTTYNNDRDSSNTAGLTIHKGTSNGSTDGTNIHPDCGGSGSQAGEGGIIERDKEIILKTNTKYIIRVTSGAASNSIATHLDWYEHLDTVNT